MEWVMSDKVRSDKIYTQVSYIVSTFVKFEYLSLEEWGFPFLPSTFYICFLNITTKWVLLLFGHYKKWTMSYFDNNNNGTHLLAVKRTDRHFKY